jgi:hypothetical protein
MGTIALVGAPHDIEGGDNLAHFQPARWRF